MTGETPRATRVSGALIAVLVVVGIVGALLGMVASAFSWWGTALVGLAVAVAGIIALLRRAGWGLVAIVLGGALLLGVGVYTGLGYIEFDTPDCGTACGEP